MHFYQIITTLFLLSLRNLGYGTPTPGATENTPQPTSPSKTKPTKKTSGESSNSKSSSKSETCAKVGKTMCTMDYAPAECTLEFTKFIGIKVETTKMIAEGSNACKAKAKLIEEACLKNKSFDEKQAEKIICKPTEADPKK